MIQRLNKNVPGLSVALLWLAASLSWAQNSYYVDGVNGDDGNSGSGWGSAVKTIQTALSLAGSGDLVWVTNGTYAAAGGTLPPDTGSLPCVIVVPDGVTVRSVNGPASTVIVGSGTVPSASNGVRCAYLGSGAVLSGFTLTNGVTYDGSYYSTYSDFSGGGVFCADASAVVTNCTITGCAAIFGGGACGGTLYNCTLSGNNVSYDGILYGACGGGAYDSTLYDCTLNGNTADPANGGCGGAVGGDGSYWLFDGQNSVLSNCVLSANSAYDGGGAYSSTLIFCTLIRNTATDIGGGACSGDLYNSTVTGNSAANDGGGVYGGGTLRNCALTGNTAGNSGGGTRYSTYLYNCTLTGNTATNSGGGAYGGTLNNCIAWGNVSLGAVNQNIEAAAGEYSCAPELTSGTGNLAVNPKLAGAWRLATNSPCIGAGSSDYSNGVDLDGEVWRTPPSMGCDEVYAGGLTGSLSVAIVRADSPIVAGRQPGAVAGTLEGKAVGTSWSFDDGTGETNNLWTSHVWSTTGTHSIVLTAWNETMSVSTSVTVQVVAPSIRYVAVNGGNTPPYDSWARAAATIQDAIDASSLYGFVLVSNGVYAVGGGHAGGMTNRIVVTNNISVVATNGPAVTFIVGQGPCGPAAIRCAHLASGTLLSGFTLTNGATVAGVSGGGVYAEAAAVITNCTFKGNAAADYGGGAYGGTFRNCLLIGNSANNGGGVCNSLLYDCSLSNNTATGTEGGGAEYSTLYRCTLAGNKVVGDAGTGGGANNSALVYCTLSSNSATYGGGARNGNLYGCTLAGNTATNGGGAYAGTFTNCTFSGNTAGNCGGAAYATLFGCVITLNRAVFSGNGGTFGSALVNCTVTSNSATGGTGGIGGNAGSPHFATNCIVWGNVPLNVVTNGGTFAYSCAPELTTGAGNLTNDPKFVNAAAGNCRLQTNSPCLNAGVNQDWMAGAMDLDGNPRIRQGAVDMGAYEAMFSRGMIISVQ